MLSYRLCLIGIITFIKLSVNGGADAAICGETEFFEYKFRPIEVSPVNQDEVANSKKRCGEKECDVMIMLNGENRCKKGDHGDVLMAPKNKNKVSGPEFKPSEIGWKVHHEWKLSEAKSSPIKIEVCDEDGAFQGRNDELVNTEHQSLQPGCHTFKKVDDEKDHKWFIQYELCCRPIGGEEDKGEQPSGGRKGSSRGSGGFSEGYPSVSSTPSPSSLDRYGIHTKSIGSDRTGLGSRKSSGGRYSPGIGKTSLGGGRKPYDSDFGSGSRIGSSRNRNIDDILNGERTRYKGNTRIDDLLKGSRYRNRGSSRTDDLLKGTRDRYRGKSRIDQLLERTSGKHSRYTDLLNERRDRYSGERGTSGYSDYLRNAGRDISPTRSRSRYDSDRYVGDAGKYGTGGRKNYGTGKYDYGQWRSKNRD